MGPRRDTRRDLPRGGLARAARSLLRDPCRPGWRAVISSAACAAVAATVGATTLLPAWDVVWLGSIAVATAAVAALQPRRVQLLALALGAILSLGVCELVARLGRGFSPYLRAPAVALREDAYALEFYCELVDDKPREVAPPVAAGWRRQAEAGEGPLVVHMGDSMLVSRPTGGFVSQLAQRWRRPDR
ncbi:MAG: hypothetical protein H6700_01080 [Myxococcales bacterium]|nr:hypothetical protein [Myxococcales bacterium]